MNENPNYTRDPGAQPAVAHPPLPPLRFMNEQLLVTELLMFAGLSQSPSLTGQRDAINSAVSLCVAMTGTTRQHQLLTLVGKLPPSVTALRAGVLLMRWARSDATFAVTGGANNNTVTGGAPSNTAPSIGAPELVATLLHHIITSQRYGAKLLRHHHDVVASTLVAPVSVVGASSNSSTRRAEQVWTSLSGATVETNEAALLWIREAYGLATWAVCAALVDLPAGQLADMPFTSKNTASPENTASPINTAPAKDTTTLLPAHRTPALLVSAALVVASASSLRSAPAWMKLFTGDATSRAHACLLSQQQMLRVALASAQHQPWHAHLARALTDVDACLPSMPH